MPIYKGNDRIERIWKGNNFITQVAKGNTAIFPEGAGFALRESVTVANLPSGLESYFGNFRPYACTSSPNVTGINSGDSRLSVAVKYIGGKYVPYISVLSYCSTVNIRSWLSLDLYNGDVIHGAIGCHYAGGSNVKSSTFIFSGCYQYYDVCINGNFAGFTGVPAGSSIFPLLFEYTTDNMPLLSNVSWSAVSVA